MSIVSSVIVSTNTQIDGRKWVHELHTDQLGIKYVRDYLANSALDLNASLAAYAVVLATAIKQAEIDINIISVLNNGSLATLTFLYSTAAENRTALRVAYLNAIKQDAIMIGDFLFSLTDGQLQTIFSMTAGQVTTLRTNKLTPAASLAASIRSSAGQ